MTRWLIALLLTLVTPALAEGPELKLLQFTPRGIRSQRQQVVFQFGQDFLQVYPRGKTAWLDVYRNGRRISHRPLGGTHWVDRELGVALLDENDPEGWALWVKPAKVLYVQAISKNWKGPSYTDEFADSEFSTTGWSTVGVGSNPQNKRFRIEELHESPGEEGDNGRVMVQDYVMFEWDPTEGRFIKQPES